MKTRTIEIIDRGRGPQLSTTRLTVMDIFYYLNRGYDFDFIHMAIPTLSREEFDVVAEYVDKHREELIEKDRRIDERIQREIAEQHARGGIFAPCDPNETQEERMARLRATMEKQIAERKNGSHSS